MKNDKIGENFLNNNKTFKKYKNEKFVWKIGKFMKSKKI